MPSLMSNRLEHDLQALRDEELLAYLEPIALSVGEEPEHPSAPADSSASSSALKLGAVLDSVKAAMEEICVAVQTLHPSSADSRAPATNLGAVSRNFDSVASMLGEAASDLKAASYHMASIAAEVRRVQHSGVLTYRTARIGAPSRVANRCLKTNMRYKAQCAQRPWLDVDCYKSYVSKNHSAAAESKTHSTAAAESKNHSTATDAHLVYVCDASEDLAVYVHDGAFAVVIPRTGAHWMTNFSCSGVVVSCLLTEDDKENTPPHRSHLFRCLADELDYDDAVRSVEETRPVVESFSQPAQPLYEFFPGDLEPAEYRRARQADELTTVLKLQKSRRLTCLPFSTTEAAFKAACCAYACKKSRAQIMERISVADTPKEAKTAVFLCPKSEFDGSLWTDQGLCKEVMRHLFATKSGDYLDELEALRTILHRHFRVPEHRVYFLEASPRDELWGCKTDHAHAMEVLYDQARAGKIEAVYRYLEGKTQTKEEREALGLPGRNLFGECWTDVWRHVCWKMSRCGYYEPEVRRKYYMTSLDGKTGISDVPLLKVEVKSERTWECLGRILPCLRNYRVCYDYTAVAAESMLAAVGSLRSEQDDPNTAQDDPNTTQNDPNTARELTAVEETILIFPADQDRDAVDQSMPWLTPSTLEIFKQRRDLDLAISAPLLKDAVAELRRVRETIVANLDQHDPDWVCFNADYERLGRARAVIQHLIAEHPSLDSDAIEYCLEFMKPAANCLSVVRVSLYQQDRLHIYNRLMREFRRAQSTDIDGSACFVRFECPCEFQPVHRYIFFYFFFKILCKIFMTSFSPTDSPCPTARFPGD